MRRADQLWAQLPDPLRRLVHRIKIRPGHYYSPYPDLRELRQREHEVFGYTEALAGIDLQETSQLDLLEELASFYPELPWRGEPTPGLAYHYDNRPYSWGDGVHLACMLLKLRPQRYLEVGSGYSSALALDVRDHLLGGQMELTCIDPYPERLLEVIGDAAVDLVRRRVQDVPLDLFRALEAGDLLVIDTSHTLKPGGDVNHLLFEVLPVLAPGVVVHLHDIFTSFEYPPEWVYAGRAWTEAYAVRAFLQFNDRWRIVLWTAYAQDKWPDWYATHMPRCAANPGASLYLTSAAV